MKFKSDVEKYFIRYKTLRKHIYTVYRKAKKEFKNAKQISVEISYDPECCCGKCHYPMLYIRYEKYPKDMMYKIRNFRNQFARPRFGKFLITTDYQ